MDSAIASLTAGLTPDQVHTLEKQNHDVEIYACSIVFSILAILAVAVRVTSRHMKKVAIGVDDIFIMAALVITLAQTIFICIGVRDYGLGHHIWTLNENQFIMFNKLWYTVGTLQSTILFLTKISLLMLFHRIFVTPGFRLTVKVIAAVMVMWWVGTVLADSLICIPIEHNWMPSIPAHCGNKQLLFIIPPIPWIVTDAVILIMPLPMVWKLQLPTVQRVGIAGLFLLGGLALVSSCVRYSYLFFQPDDVTYYLTQAAIWTIIEADVTIISACLIVSRPWLLKLYPSRFIAIIQQKTASMRKSSTRSSTGDQKKLPLFSSFRRLAETPPAVDNGSMGAPFDFAYDTEKATQRNVYVD